ncbi:MAG TPA: LysM peptidoglycan-binding domain-containing protein [Chloroflexi bacterium]|nr:LysM peptidoglycan-binding domain-containing protein [Chloroflexota bacterium]
MAQERITPRVAERRCPNCGTRVARNAESCFMCGYDLRNQAQGRRRFSWIDVTLVVAVLAVLVFWWRVGTESVQESDGTDVVQAILPTSVPLMAATATPTPTATPPPTPTPVPIVQETLLIRHVVESGETLLSIAIDYDVTVEEIQRANNLSSELIRAGDELMIPVLRDSAAAQSSAAATDFEYIVKAGDTLSTIAITFGTTVEELLSANQLAAGEFLQPGDALRLPLLGAPPEALAVEPVATPAESTQSAALYAAPRLLTPEEGAAIARTDPVSFGWESAGALAANEWYVLQVLPRNLTARQLPPAWTKQAGFRLESSLAPGEGEAADYAWLVSIVRVNRSAEGRAFVEAASPPSVVRTFSWR